jgi:decaprenylphospho-beta-D-ribofuranose 2-oxidase
VESIELLLGDGHRLEISPTQHADLFHATCGGMGLTGIVVEATLRLKRIGSSRINSKTVRVPDLESALQVFAENAQSTYSVAWIDCLARGRELGRSLVMLGEHADEGEFSVRQSHPLPVPFDLPSSMMGRASVRVFNALYYHKAPKAPSQRQVALESYFYPLDSLADWNRLYGRNGFVQYQFVLPIECGSKGLKDVLTRIAGAGMGSFLAVLKVLGRGNENHLSFPMEGYTLALDFRLDSRVLEFLEHLDSVVSNYGGRIYLAKDARMSVSTFRAGYPRWQEFEAIRAKYGAAGEFASAQSRRLGLA